MNAGAIIAGSAVGMMIRSRLPQKIVNIVFQAIGLFTMVIGIGMAIKAENMILVIVSLAAGAIAGEAIDIGKHLRRFSERLEHKFSKGGCPRDHARDCFTEGFITASMLFCVGSMSILGAIQEGMGGTSDLLLTKSIMDGISSVALAASFGMAIAFSAIPLLIYQGGLTLLASLVMQFMTESMTADLTATGGILLIGLGINILKIKEINVINMLPSLILIVILSYFLS